jgi:hypothetical protein
MLLVANPLTAFTALIESTTSVLFGSFVFIFVFDSFRIKQCNPFEVQGSGRAGPINYILKLLKILHVRKILIVLKVLIAAVYFNFN